MSSNPKQEPAGQPQTRNETTKADAAAEWVENIPIPETPLSPFREVFRGIPPTSYVGAANQPFYGQSPIPITNMSTASGEDDGSSPAPKAVPDYPESSDKPGNEYQPRPARVSLRASLAKRRGVKSINNINYGRAATALMANDQLHLTDAALLKTYYRNHISTTIRLAEILHEKDYVQAAVALFKTGIQENTGPELMEVILTFSESLAEYITLSPVTFFKLMVLFAMLTRTTDAQGRVINADECVFANKVIVFLQELYLTTEDTFADFKMNCTKRVTAPRNADSPNMATVDMTSLPGYHRLQLRKASVEETFESALCRHDNVFIEAFDDLLKFTCSECIDMTKHDLIFEKFKLNPEACDNHPLLLRILPSHRVEDFEDFILRWKMAIDHAEITESTIGVNVGLQLSDFELVSRLMYSLKACKKFKTKVCEVLKDEKVKLIHDVPNCTFAEMEKHLATADEYFRNDPDCVSIKFAVSLVLTETDAYQKKYNIKPDSGSGLTGQTQRSGKKKKKKQRAPLAVCFHCSSGDHKTQHCPSGWEATAAVCSSVKSGRPCSYGLDCKFKGHTAAANAAYANAPSTYHTQAPPVTPGVAPANQQQPNTNLTAGDEDRYKNMGDEVRTCNCIGCDGCKADGCTNKFELPASQKAWLKQRGMFFTTRCSDCKAFPNPKFVKAQQRNNALAPGAMIAHQAPPPAAPTSTFAPQAQNFISCLGLNDSALYAGEQDAGECFATEAGSFLGSYMIQVEDQADQADTISESYRSTQVLSQSTAAAAEAHRCCHRALQHLQRHTDTATEYYSSHREMQQLPELQRHTESLCNESKAGCLKSVEISIPTGSVETSAVPRRILQDETGGGSASGSGTGSGSGQVPTIDELNDDFEADNCEICEASGEQMCSEKLCWQCCFNNGCDCCSDMMKQVSIHHHSPEAYRHNVNEDEDISDSQDEHCCAVCKTVDNDGELCAEMLCWQCCINNDCDCDDKDTGQDSTVATLNNDVNTEHTMFDGSPTQARCQQLIVEAYFHRYNYACITAAWHLWRSYSTVVHGKFSTPQQENIHQEEVFQAQNSFEVLSIAGDTSDSKSSESEISEMSDPSDQKDFNARQHTKFGVQHTVRRNPVRQRNKPTELYVPSPSGMQQTTHEYEAAMDPNVSDASIHTDSSGEMSMLFLTSGTSGSPDATTLDMDACVMCHATLDEAITLCAHSMCDNCCPAVNCSISPMSQKMIEDTEYISRQSTSADLVLMFDIGGEISKTMMSQLRMSTRETAKNSLTGLKLTPAMTECFTDELADTLWSQQQVDLMNTCNAIHMSMHQKDLNDRSQQKMSNSQHFR